MAASAASSTDTRKLKPAWAVASACTPYCARVLLPRLLLPSRHHLHRRLLLLPRLSLLLLVRLVRLVLLVPNHVVLAGPE